MGGQDMTTSKRAKMHLFSLFLLVSMAAKSSQLSESECGAEFRRPEYTDISVECGTSTITLNILICPAMYTGYNESLLILNHVFNNPECKGTLEESSSTSVVKFTFPINSTGACGSIFRTTSEAGTGAFSDFSNIQTVNISGVVRSHDPTTGTVTYNAELKYYYSCAYALEYLINNTQVDVSASSIAVKDNNGSFVSTLNMGLYSDVNYTTPLVIPPLGLELRTSIFVQVKATNLTAQYNVLLDRCYASTSPHPTNSTFFNLFVSCSRDQMTTMHENGLSHHARFSFPAFRFIEQQNETVSTYYLHCITRLCERSTCSEFLQCNNRRKRAIDSSTLNDGVSESTTLSTANPIITQSETAMATLDEGHPGHHYDSTVGLAVALGILSLAVVVVAGMAAVYYRRLKHF